MAPAPLFAVLLGVYSIVLKILCNFFVQLKAVGQVGQPRPLLQRGLSLQTRCPFLPCRSCRHGRWASPSLTEFGSWVPHTCSGPLESNVDWLLLNCFLDTSVRRRQLKHGLIDSEPPKIIHTHTRARTHSTHTHTHIYIYIYAKINGRQNEFNRCPLRCFALGRRPERHFPHGLPSRNYRPSAKIVWWYMGYYGFRIFLKVLLKRQTLTFYVYVCRDNLIVEIWQLYSLMRNSQLVQLKRNQARQQNMEVT